MMELTLDALRRESAEFAESPVCVGVPELYGVTDGKRIGTFVEQSFRQHLVARYQFDVGNSASGIDFPGLDTDMKVTSVRHPQSSSPYRTAGQKVYGLGYNLLVFVYEKGDDEPSRTGELSFHHILFVDKHATADYQTTRGILELLERDANEDDMVSFIHDRNLPVDEVGAVLLARRIMSSPPSMGYLTIPNALQWRLQFRRVIQIADETAGVERLK